MSIVHFSTIADEGLIKLTDENVGSSSTFPTTATAALRFETDGELNFTANSTIPPDPADEWYRFQPQAGIGVNYEARLTVKSGDAPTNGPTPGTWVSLSLLRVWDLVTSGVESLNGGWEVEIRQAGTGVVVAAATYTMSAATSV